jgi:DTW domain-containing protein YfiP
VNPTVHKPVGDPAAFVCRKPDGACTCTGLVPVGNKRQVLILQHPQEQDVTLGTACIAHGILSNVIVKVGLSWPNLDRALGRGVQPKRWGVLYLGARPEQKFTVPLTAVSRKGEPLPDQRAALANLDGIVLLDGTWSQAKALWWRNPWLLKLQRLVLAPTLPSRYGKLRKEPRRDSLSTLEAAALALSHLEGKPELFSQALVPFEALIARHKGGT